MHTFTRILIAAALLGAPACDSDTKTEPKPTKAATKPDIKKDVKAVTPAKPVDKVAVDTPKPEEKGPPAADSPEGKVVLAAIVAKEISGDPDRADEILGKHGLDRDKLDDLMFAIAADPDLTKKYMEARRSS